MKKYLFIVINIILLFPPATYSQWITQSPLPTGHTIWSTSFINNEVGWLVGNNGVIIKTWCIHIS